MIRIYISENIVEKAGKAGEHSAGLELLRRGLKECFGLPVTAEKLEETIAYGSHGKPYLRGMDDIHFNVSHSGSIAVCALADVPVGIDVEAARGRKISGALVRRAMTENEIAESGIMERSSGDEMVFLRYWTLKEAYLKWSGSGLSADLREVEFALREAAGDAVWTRAGCSDKSIRAAQTHIGGAAVVSVVYQPGNV